MSGEIPARRGGGLDERPERRRALGARARAAGRLRVQDVGVAARGGGGEAGLALGRVGERIGGRAGGRALVAGAVVAEQRAPRHDREHDDENEREHAAGSGRHPPLGSQRRAGAAARPGAVGSRRRGPLAADRGRRSLRS